MHKKDTMQAGYGSSYVRPTHNTASVDVTVPPIVKPCKHHWKLHSSSNNSVGALKAVIGWFYCPKCMATITHELKW